MITIKKYNKNFAKQWDKFINISNNGTIFQTRKFLNYHIDRQFKDYSLIVYKNKTLVAVIAGACVIKNKKNIYYSHPGTSYAGIVIKLNLRFALINKIVESLDAYLVKKKFHQIFLINSPNVYCSEHLYLLFL